MEAIVALFLRSCSSWSGLHIMERVGGSKSVNWWYRQWISYTMTDQRHALVYIKRHKTL